MHTSKRESGTACLAAATAARSRSSDEPVLDSLEPILIAFFESADGLEVAAIRDGYGQLRDGLPPERR